MITGTPFAKPQDIDLQLDLINHNWDSAPFFEYVKVQSEIALEKMNCITDIRVGPRDEERLDVFPAAEPNSPILVFVHGGWWRGGTRKLWSYVANGFVSHGFTVVISDYALTPKVTVPDITQATRAAVVWAYEHAEEINGDREKLFVAGHSAGGQQAGMIAVTDWTQYGLPENPLRGVIPMSGIFDMRVMQYSWLQPFLQLNGNTAMSESPQFQVPDTAPPILIMLGDEEAEEFHRQARDFEAAYKAKGHRADYYTQTGEDHSTYIYMMGNPESPVVSRIVDFCKSC